MKNNKSNKENIENTTIIDDYDFSELSTEEITRFPRLYISLDSCSDFYDAMCTYSEMGKNRVNSLLLFDEKWGFEKSGKYKAIMTDLRVSKRCSRDYIIDVLINRNQIRHIKFSSIWNDEIYQHICKYFGNQFISINKEDFIGKLVTFEVKNIATNTGNTFSKICKFKILNDDDCNLTFKIIEIMLGQVEESTN